MDFFLFNSKLLKNVTKTVWFFLLKKRKKILFLTLFEASNTQQDAGQDTDAKISFKMTFCIRVKKQISTVKAQSGSFSTNELFNMRL